MFARFGSPTYEILCRLTSSQPTVGAFGHFQARRRIVAKEDNTVVGDGSQPVIVVSGLGYAGRVNQCPHGSAFRVGVTKA